MQLGTEWNRESARNLVRFGRWAEALAVSGKPAEAGYRASNGFPHQLKLVASNIKKKPAEAGSGWKRMGLEIGGRV